MISDADTLAEDVHVSHLGRKRAPVWGNPLLSTTPVSMAIRDLAERTEALEDAVRAMSLELQRLKDDA